MNRVQTRLKENLVHFNDFIEAGGEKDRLLDNDRFGNDKFGIGLFGADQDEGFGRRGVVEEAKLALASGQRIPMPRKEWTPCSAGVISNATSKSDGNRFNKCLASLDYDAKARKCVNWNRSGAIDRTISAEGVACRPLCKALLADFPGFEQDVVNCAGNESETARGGGKGKGKKSKQTKIQTIATDGLLMFDDEFIEGEGVVEKEAIELVDTADDFMNAPSRGPGEPLDAPLFDKVNVVDRFDRLEAAVEPSKPNRKGNRKGRRKNRRQ